MSALIFSTTFARNISNFLSFSKEFRKNNQILYFLEIRAAGADLCLFLHLVKIM
jgi:hypothetical protein